MKWFNRCAVIMMICVVLAGLFCNPVKAAIADPEDEEIAPCKIIYHPITLDQYTDAIFPSIRSAKDYFGWDRTYYQTSHYYAGVTYNWYYGFADGTKQYFRVNDMDEDGSLSITDINIREE